MMRFSRVAIAVALLSGACRSSDRPGSAAPARITLEQFQSLRWLEGTWRGDEAGADPFYESYRFLNDSTILSATYADSTARVVSDSGVLAFAGGRVTSRGGTAVWVLTAMDPLSLRFDPVANATNSFVWTRQSTDSWTATLRWRDAKGEQRQRAYRMELVSR